MNAAHSTVILYTRDTKLGQRLRPRFREALQFHDTGDKEELDGLLHQTGRGVVLLDLRLPVDHPGPEDFVKAYPRHIFIGLGLSGTDAAAVPAGAGLYAVEDLHSSPGSLLGLACRALEHQDLLEECRWLRARVEHQREAVSPPSPPPPGFSVRELIRIVRCMHNPDALQESLLEELATTLQLTRVGIVLRRAPGEAFDVTSGWMLLKGTESARFAADHPFVSWLERHLHRVSRQQLPQMQDRRQSRLLEQMLDQLGAEILFPLRGRTGLLGWWFTGYPLSGEPFTADESDRFMLVADLMAVSLESALLYQEVNRQKILARSLLEALPSGIIHTDAAGALHWVNGAATRILQVKPPPEPGAPLGALGARFAEWAQGLRPEPGQPVTRDLLYPLSGSPLRVTAIRLSGGQTDLGILYTIQDRSLEVTLTEQEEQINRQNFWKDLAASISHEIRNPLVAIKTFAQLLPERYEDAEFRDEFRFLMNREIHRLHELTEQINHFAQIPDLEFTRLGIENVLPLALKQSFQTENAGEAGGPRPEVSLQIAPDLPRILGDAAALGLCFQHLQQNALEACAQGGALTVSVETVVRTTGKEEIRIRFQDTGRGLPAVDMEKLFSPLFTTKAKGLGLGLAFARRTARDHGGRIEIRPAHVGTICDFCLPLPASGDPA